MTNAHFNRWRQLVLIGIVIAGFPLMVRADDDEYYDSDRKFSFGPRASYFDPEDGDADWSGGAQLRFRPSEFLGFEGAIDYRREEFGETRVDIYPVQISLLAYILPLHPVNIFLLGGGGWYYTHVDRPSPGDDDTDHRMGAHAGAGLEFELNEAWSIDGTYRYVWIEDITSNDSGNLLDKDYSDRGSQVTIGLNYRF